MLTTTKTEAGSALLVPGGEELAHFAPIVDARMKPYTIGHRSGLTLVCIAFDAGTVLPDHIANGPILIQTVTGEVVVDVGGNSHQLGLGAVLHIDSRVNHAVRAVTRARILVTLMSSLDDEQPHIPGIIKTALDSNGSPELLTLTDVSASPSTGPEGHEGHSCTCGESDEGLPELDVRTIPHTIRHATVFGALNGLGPSSAMVLIAHHNPLPLLGQIERMFQGAVEVAYLNDGPDVWKLRLTRTR